MMTVTMVATASAVLFTGMLLAACRSAENPVPAEWGDTLEVGVLYDYDMRVHCGMRWLGTFNGQSWFADDAPIKYSSLDNPPPLLPWELADGLMRLIDADLIEYRIVGSDIVIEYQPTPQEQPACY